MRSHDIFGAAEKGKNTLFASLDTFPPFLYVLYLPNYSRDGPSFKALYLPSVDGLVHAGALMYIHSFLINDENEDEQISFGPYGKMLIKTYPYRPQEK